MHNTLRSTSILGPVAYLERLGRKRTDGHLSDEVEVVYGQARARA
jgi:hypothetical protein